MKFKETCKKAGKWCKEHKKGLTIAIGCGLYAGLAYEIGYRIGVVNVGKGLAEIYKINPDKIMRFIRATSKDKSFCIPERLSIKRRPAFEQILRDMDGYISRFE